MRLIITFLMALVPQLGGVRRDGPPIANKSPRELEQAKSGETRAARSHRGTPVCLKCA